IRRERENGSAVSPTARPVPFRRTDAAFLTPFVGLLEMHGRTSNRYLDMKDLLVGLTRSLTSALDAKDSYTYGHSERVARIAVELGRELDLDEDEIGDIYLAGLLHDIGKIGVSDAILGKREKLTADEFEQIRQRGVGESLRQAIDGVLRNDQSSLLSVAISPTRIESVGA